MRIIDKIEQHNMYFVEHELPNVTFYEGYSHFHKEFQIKNNYDKAVEEWCNMVKKCKN